MKLTQFVVVYCIIYTVYPFDIIENYVRIQNPPVGIIIFSCWSQQINLQLLKSLHNHPLTIQRNFSKITELLNVYNLVITDAQCKYFDYLLEKANESDLIRSPIKWLILNSTNEWSPKINIPINSHFTVVVENKSDEFHFHLIYKIRDQYVIRNPLAIYLRGPNFFKMNSFSIAVNRSNLMGTAVKVSYVLTNNDSINHLTDYRDTHIDNVSKMSYLQMFTLLEFLNARKIFILRHSWGYKEANSSIFDGMLGDLQQGIADIAGTSLFYSEERITYFAFTSINTPNQIKFIFRAPPLSYVENIFTLPFETHVWYCCYALCFITLLFLYIITICEKKIVMFKISSNIMEKKYEPKFGDVCMLEIGAITQQGVEVVPGSYSGRCTIFIVLLILMFLYTSYSANIVVILQSTSHNIRTVKDLLYSKMPAGAEDVVYSRFYFTHEQEPLRKLFYEKKIGPKGQQPNFLPLYDGICKVRTEFFAFHCELSSGYKIVKDIFHENEKCGLVEIDFFRKTHYPAVPILRNSPYKEIFEYGSKKLYETGVRSREFARINHRKPQCLSRSSTFISVGIQDGYFAFLLFILGVFLSLIMLIGEIFLKKYYLFFNQYLKNIIT